MPWSQNYDPLRFWPLSTFVAAVPVLTLFFVLLVMRKKVWISALCGLVAAAVLAASVLGMPAPMISGAVLHGFVFGFFQIAWIIIASIFLYNISLETGQFEVMKQSIASLSQDVRVQTVLIAFCFGAFLEGTGGGGAPVAIAGYRFTSGIAVGLLFAICTALLVAYKLNKGMTIQMADELAERRKRSASS